MILLSQLLADEESILSTCPSVEVLLLSKSHGPVVDLLSVFSLRPKAHARVDLAQNALSSIAVSRSFSLCFSLPRLSVPSTGACLHLQPARTDLHGSCHHSQCLFLGSLHPRGFNEDLRVGRNTGQFGTDQLPKLRQFPSPCTRTR